MLPQIDRPAVPTVPAGNRLSPAQAPSVSASTGGNSVPWEGRIPPRSSHTAAASRRTPCAAATPHGAFELAQPLEHASLLALSGNPNALGDPLPHLWLPSLFHARAYSLLTRRHLPSEGRLPPQPCAGEPGRRPRPEDRKARPAELLCAPCSRRSARQLVEKHTRPRVGRFPLEGVGFAFQTTLPIRALCAGQSRRNVEGERVLCAALAGRNEEWVDRIEELWFAVWPVTGENHELRSHRNRRKTIPGQHW